MYVNRPGGSIFCWLILNRNPGSGTSKSMFEEANDSLYTYVGATTDIELVLEVVVVVCSTSERLVLTAEQVETGTFWFKTSGESCCASYSLEVRLWSLRCTAKHALSNFMIKKQTWHCHWKS